MLAISACLPHQTASASERAGGGAALILAFSPKNRATAGRDGSGAESREPRAESREPRAESREPRAESRESRVESREPRAESREPRAESREPRAESREPRAESREPGAGSREPRAESREPRAESREPRAESREPRAESREPGAGSREPRAESREPRAESREPRAESREPGAESREPRAEPSWGGKIVVCMCGARRLSASSQECGYLARAETWGVPLLRCALMEARPDQLCWNSAEEGRVMRRISGINAEVLPAKRNFLPIGRFFTEM